jgi:hypothetical protein
VRLTVRRDVTHGRLGGVLRLPAALLAVATAVLFLAIAVLAAVAAWPCRLLAGRYPSRLRAVAVAALAFAARASCYACMLSPALPFSRPGQPVEVELPAVSGRPWLRLPALIPVAPLLVLEMLVAMLCAVPAWFAVVFWGRLPGGLAEVMEQPQRLIVRFWAYALLLSDTYPWFQPQAGPVSDAVLS